VRTVSIGTLWVRRDLLLPFHHSSTDVDVSWRGQVVARDESGLEAACPLIRYERPGRTAEQEGMEPDPAVGCSHDVAALGTPGGGDPVDGAWIEARPVGEDDQRRLGVPRERREPTAKRRPGAALPVGAANRALAGLDRVRAQHDEDPAERRARVQGREDLREEHLLLRRVGAVPR
jgi:hypothetical protein